jgi:putative ABC transport system permease protein
MDEFRQTPPRFLMRFFQWYCHPKLRDFIEGDLLEVYSVRLRRVGKRKADLQFAIDVLLLFRPGIIRPAEGHLNSNTYGMYKNYLKVTLRVFNRERLYTLINVAGLALGFTCCLIIYLFIKDELSYDKFHQDSDRIYRVASAYMRQGQWEPYASNSWRTGELINAKFGEIEQLVKMRDDEDMFVYKDKHIYETRVAYVEHNFFKVFSFPLIKGNAAEALKGSNKVVISESTAAKYFDTEDPLGKVFEISDGAVQLQVSGVMRDMPPNAHFHFDFLISNETLRQVAPESLFTQVGWDSQYLYIKTAPGVNPQRMEAAFPDFIDQNLDYLKSANFKLFLQPLESIHLESNIGLEIEPNGSLDRVYTFSVIAVFILVIACVNYVNLTTARSLRRAREVGMRKVLGARRTDLLGQFLSESLLTTFIAIVIALALATLLLPDFNHFAGKEISLSVLFSPEIVLTLFAAVIVVGFVSGIYPSIVLSSFRPLSNLKGIGNAGRSGFVFRRGLVGLQFVISIGLIAASAVVFQQWDFLKNKPLGVNKEMLVAIPLQTMDRNQLPTLKRELFSNASIATAGTSNMKMPGWISNSTPYKAEGAEADDEVGKTMKIIRVDFDFLSTVEAQFLNGRNFSMNFPSDSISSIILNESAVAQLNWKEPLGKWLELGGRRYDVVGIVNDFHFESLYREIPPTIFILSSDWLNWLYVRIDDQNVPATIEHIETVYGKFVSNRDFSYTFMNDDIEQQYVTEEKFTETFTLFTCLAIVIACLGTFGLISFAAERKSKEIGIRKVLGASVSNVSFLLVKEFLILLFVASIVAWPLTWYFLDRWIDTFIYRTAISPTPFLVATLIAGFIVVLTTGLRAIKAGLANPIDSLRDE